MKTVQKRTHGDESRETEIFPKYLMYDVTNVCNARCTHCPQSMIASRTDYEPQHLSWELYEKTIKEISKYNVDLVRFTGDGEPLLHPQLPQMIAVAKKLGISQINLTTNGSLLKGKLLETILNNPPDVFDISLDAFTSETYSKVRVGLNFDQVKSNIMMLLKQRKPNLSKVIVSMVAQSGLEDEVKAFQKYWESKVDFVAIRTKHSNINLTGLIEDISYPRWPCQHLWGRLVIDFRGHIRYCPIDWLDQTSLGSVEDLTLYEAWHSHQLNQLREKHLQSEYENCGVCTNCKDWVKSPWEKGWLKIIQNIK